MYTMYPGKVNSPTTDLAVQIDSDDTTIVVEDATVLPTAPNLAVLGVGEDAETVLYTGKTSTDLTGCTRGFQGTAKTWLVGTQVTRFFTAYDYDSLRLNLTDVSQLPDQMAGENLAQYDCVYQKTTDGKWYKCAASAVATKTAQFAIALVAITSGSTGLLQVFGRITNPSWSWTPGEILYVGSSGAMSHTKGYYERAVAWAITATSILFFPKSSVETSMGNFTEDISKIDYSYIRDVSKEVTAVSYNYERTHTQTMTNPSDQSVAPTNFSNVVTSV